MERQRVTAPLRPYSGGAFMRQGKSYRGGDSPNSITQIAGSVYRLAERSQGNRI
jgi:hypothetical protein